MLPWFQNNAGLWVPSQVAVRRCPICEREVPLDSEGRLPHHRVPEFPVLCLGSHPESEWVSEEEQAEVTATTEQMRQEFIAEES